MHVGASGGAIEQDRPSEQIMDSAFHRIVGVLCAFRPEKWLEGGIYDP